jgi:outer membrane protein assembly factor BamB
LNALDAATGTKVWSRNAGSDTKTNVPFWGFSSSPLVAGNVLIVATAGQAVGYDLATGKPLWFGPKGGTDYSSPQLVTIDGVQQILLLSVPGVTSIAPADGKVLWKYSLPDAVRIVQPVLITDNDMLISEGGQGLRRITVTHGSNGWTVKEQWRSIGLKPYFNDSVVHKGYAYGFDGSYLSCIDLKDGTRKWKGGKYGNGQFVLLADQDLLLVLSEKGDLALVSASPDQFKELARHPAIKGKTWNHPVLAGNVLLVRNGEEMAAFRLSRASS